VGILPARRIGYDCTIAFPPSGTWSNKEGNRNRDSDYIIPVVGLARRSHHSSRLGIRLEPFFVVYNVAGVHI
jgi:hypothetical protein